MIHDDKRYMSCCQCEYRSRPEVYAVDATVAGNVGVCACSCHGDVTITEEGEDPFAVQERWTDEERDRLYNAEMGVVEPEANA